MFKINDSRNLTIEILPSISTAHRVHTHPTYPSRDLLVHPGRHVLHGCLQCDRERDGATTT